MFIKYIQHGLEMIFLELNHSFYYKRFLVYHVLQCLIFLIEDLFITKCNDILSVNKVHDVPSYEMESN